MSNQQQESDNDIVLPVGTKLKLEVNILPGKVQVETFVVIKAFNLKEELEKINIPPSEIRVGRVLTAQSKLSTHLLSEGFVTCFPSGSV